MTSVKHCAMCDKEAKMLMKYPSGQGFIRLCNKCYTAEITKKIVEQLEDNHCACALEYKFDKQRRFKFDIALPVHKVAVEIDGGVYIKSGHSGGSNAEYSMERGNLACMNGWMVLHYTPRMAMDFHKVAIEVLLTIERRGSR